MEEKVYIDKISEDLQTLIQDEDLLTIDKLFKSCKFSEVVDLIKNNILHKLTYTVIDSDNPLYLIQSILTIYVFSLLKIHKYDQISDIFNRYKFPEEVCLFPLRFLEGKYYFLINDVPTALNIFNKLIKKYSEGSSIEKLESECEIKYFKLILENMFAVKNTDNKIKKCFFEIKNSLIKLGLVTEAFKSIEKCYEKYPDDIVVLSEMIKQSIMVSNFVKVEEIYLKLKQMSLTITDENMKVVYENYLNYSEALTWISKGEYEIAKNKLTEILRNNPDNVIVINNIAALNLYLNRVDKSYSDFKIILDKDQMNSPNEITSANMNILADIFNMPKINI